LNIGENRFESEKMVAHSNRMLLEMNWKQAAGAVAQ